ncbi:MAG: hypothetical protein Q8O95_01275 [bacterium]|nr:hypothetical protein [bacterium]
MSSPRPHPGFFPNLISVLIFCGIMIGMFFGLTRFYPQLAMRYVQQNGDTTFVVDRSPLVRGIVSGVETAQISSRVDAGEPLNINQISGYRQGILASGITSKNWYNLDRQLFRVQGLELGVINAIQTSKTEQERATLSYQVKLIQQIQTALGVNLEDLLQSNPDNRRQALQNYLTNLRQLAQEGGVEIENMQRIIDEAQTEYQLNVDTAEQFSGAFTSETDNFQTGNIDTNLNLYLDARKKAEESRVVINSTQEILNRLTPLVQRANQIIPAIEANFEALEAGIKVTPTPGVNLPVFEQ